jgi:hypothetical protein
MKMSVLGSIPAGPCRTRLRMDAYSLTNLQLTTTFGCDYAAMVMVCLQLN